MSPVGQVPSFLLLSTDPDFYPVMESPSQWMVTNSKKETEQLIELYDGPWGGFFIDPTDRPDALELLSFFHLKYASVPIYLIGKGVDQYPVLKKNSRQLGVQGSLKEWDQIATIVDQIELNYGRFKNFSKGTQDRDDSHDMNLKRDDFHAVKIQNFLTGHESLFDIFVQLRKDKFVKVVEAGDCISAKRLEIYMDKGLEYLFIKKDVQSDYVIFCNEVVANLHSVGVSTDSQIRMTLSSGQETLSYLQDHGIDEESIQFAHQFTANAMEVVESIAEQGDAVKALMLNAESFEHSSGTALIAGVLAQKLGYSDQSALLNLGVASLLHDVGLNRGNISSIEFLNEFDLLQTIETKEGTQEEREELKRLYEEHPKNALFILGSLSSINDEILLLIEQHHMRPMGRGFPSWNFKEMQLHPLGQVLAIADEYATTINAYGRKKISRKKLEDFSGTLGEFEQSLRKVFIETFFLR